MAFVLTEQSVEKVGWVANITGDVSGTEDIKAAASGLSHYIESVAINAVAAQTVTIGAGETGGAVTAPIIGPVSCTTSGGNLVYTFTRPIKMAANVALVIDSSGAGVVCAVVTGYTK
jgi:hypothetical protein